MSTEAADTGRPPASSVVAWIRNRYREGNRYCKAPQLDDDGVSGGRTHIGVALSELADHGVLEVYREGSPRLYRITAAIEDEEVTTTLTRCASNVDLRGRAVELAGVETERYEEHRKRRLTRGHIDEIAATLGHDAPGEAPAPALAAWLGEHYGVDGFRNHSWCFNREELLRLVDALEAEVNRGE